MRRLTPEGWQRITTGFGENFPNHREETFWTWAIEQGSAFQLAAFLIIGMLGGEEMDFPGLGEQQRMAHPVRMAWSLDDMRREMIADLLREPRRYMQ